MGPLTGSASVFLPAWETLQGSGMRRSPASNSMRSVLTAASAEPRRAVPGSTRLLVATVHARRHMRGFSEGRLVAGARHGLLLVYRTSAPSLSPPHSPAMPRSPKSRLCPAQPVPCRQYPQPRPTRARTRSSIPSTPIRNSLNGLAELLLACCHGVALDPSQPSAFTS